MTTKKKPTDKSTPSAQPAASASHVTADELIADLQRTRADFENYRKRVEQEKATARQAGKMQAVLQLLPVIDNIERALTYVPEELADNAWAQSVAGLVKHLETSLRGLELTKIDAHQGTPFDPAVHQAVSMDDGDGDDEVIAEELQPGYKMGDAVLRPSMVKVTRQSTAD